jgi:hypothetical protein
MRPVTPPQPRFVPVNVDVPALSLRRGDALAVVPVDSYRGEGIYLLMLEGVPLPVIARTGGSSMVQVVALHPGGGTASMTPEQFGDLLLGQVLAACRVLNPSLLRL